MKQIFWVVVAVVMVLVGCSAGQTAVPEPDVVVMATIAVTRAPALRPVTAVPPVVEATPEPVTGPTNPELAQKLEAELGDAVMLYQKSGGFAGVNESWWVYKDGRLRDQAGNEWQLPAQEVETLLANSKQAGLIQTSINYLPEDFCCDQFVYGLIVRQDDGNIYQVTTADGLESTPQELFQLLEQISIMIANRSEN